MMEGLKILLIEDEDVLALLVKESLETRGFEVSVASNGVDGWARYNLLKPDVCIVDIMMPRKDGYALVADIRLVDDLTPIIFLTAKTRVEDVLKGLDIGADDYIKKPFSMEELIMRIKVLVRRSSINSNSIVPPYHNKKLGKLTFDPFALKVYIGDNTIDLSKREAELLDLLIEHKNRLTERRIALIKLWGNDDIFSARSMDVYITRLRKFLRNDPALDIVNVRGQGYMLTERQS
ncbi:response regulator transcription factor [Mucilaginibacter sp. SG564]|uniref:response regulator transcription factor n=1 Tax=Mucilaginibacter sp. SG564 TaxID=2587022 RepID=UPI0020A6CCBE|nr:response regulator transcription factor [Mucilaginibacter sp. SG564]NOW95025.1 DNA-binding response OmpR family regulator [Mucilaginibacter sp. SG564]